MKNKTVRDGMQISLRPAVLEDREYLWDLHRETMRDYVEKTWGWDEAYQRRKFEETFDPLSLLIIQKDNETVGSICIKRSSEDIFLKTIEIASGQRNQGIGSQLIKELFHESDRSHLPVKLQVLKVNPARRLYERLGFQLIGQTTTHYLMRREARKAFRSIDLE